MFSACRVPGIAPGAPRSWNGGGFQAIGLELALAEDDAPFPRVLPACLPPGVTPGAVIVWNEGGLDDNGLKKALVENAGGALALFLACRPFSRSIIFRHGFASGDAWIWDEDALNANELEQALAKGAFPPSFPACPPFCFARRAPRNWETGRLKAKPL